MQWVRNASQKFSTPSYVSYVTRKQGFEPVDDLNPSISRSDKNRIYPYNINYNVTKASGENQEKFKLVVDPIPNSLN